MIKYADDIILLQPFTRNADLQSLLHAEISHARSWCEDHGLSLNNKKTKTMIVAKQTISNLDDTALGTTPVTTLKILGVTFTKSLKWSNHISSVCRKASSRLFILRRLREFMTKDDLITAYRAYIQSLLEYNSQVMVGLTCTDNDKLERIRRRAHRMICGRHCNCGEFTPLKIRRDYHAIKTFLKMRNKSHILHSLFPPVLPRSNHLRLPRSKSHRRTSSFIPYCSSLYNTLYASSLP